MEALKSRFSHDFSDTLSQFLNLFAWAPFHHYTDFWLGAWCPEQHSARSG